MEEEEREETEAGVEAGRRCSGYFPSLRQLCGKVPRYKRVKVIKEKVGQRSGV